MGLKEEGALELELGSAVSGDTQARKRGVALGSGTRVEGASLKPWGAKGEW